MTDRRTDRQTLTDMLMDVKMLKTIIEEVNKPTDTLRGRYTDIQVHTRTNLQKDKWAERQKVLQDRYSF
jgi:hypothetical protein